MEGRLCAVCNSPIGAGRLEAVPETRLCIGCARKADKKGGEFVRTATLEGTSKQGSLKRNYGGVNVERCETDAVDRLIKDREKELKEGAP